MTLVTLRNLERGGSGVRGAYLSVMQVLGLEKDFDLLARADAFGRELQDARLHAPRKSTAGASLRSLRARHRAPAPCPFQRRLIQDHLKNTKANPADGRSRRAPAQSVIR